MPGTPLFFPILFFCTSHASVLAFCFFLPHVQRREHQSKFGGVERRIASRQKRRLQTKSCFFILLLLFCFPDDYAIPCFRYLLLGHACPCKKIMLSCSLFRSLCTNHPSTTTASLSILSVCPTCKLVLAGKRGGGNVERSGKPKTCSRNSSARNEKQMTNITRCCFGPIKTIDSQNTQDPPSSLPSLAVPRYVCFGFRPVIL